MCPEKLIDTCFTISCSSCITSSVCDQKLGGTPVVSHVLQVESKLQGRTHLRDSNYLYASFSYCLHQGKETECYGICFWKGRAGWVGKNSQQCHNSSNIESHNTERSLLLRNFQYTCIVVFEAHDQKKRCGEHTNSHHYDNHSCLMWTELVFIFRLFFIKFVLKLFQIHLIIL